jgi:hypothetical protein
MRESATLELEEKNMGNDYAYGAKKFERPFFEPNDVYLCEVQNIESPMVGRFSVQVNKDRWEGRCGVQTQLPGRAIMQLYEACVEEAETDIDERGMMTLTGNKKRRSRFAVTVYANLTQRKQMELQTPVGGVVIGPAPEKTEHSFGQADEERNHRAEQCEAMNVKELRKMALDAGFTPNAVKYMKRAELLKLII